MKKRWIEYTDTWIKSPMSYWVHIEQDDSEWFNSKNFDPPKQQIVAGKGFPNLFVEFNSIILRFSSIAELEEMISILSKKIMPTSIYLSEKRAKLGYKKGNPAGPNSHWLSRLPSKLMPWKIREKLVAYLKESLAEFNKKI